MTKNKIARVDEKVLGQLVLIGDLMSNVLYNLSQRDGIADIDKSTMAELVRKWDASLNHLNSTKNKI